MLFSRFLPRDSNNLGFVWSVGGGGGGGGILLAENPPPRYSRQPLKSASNGVSLLEGGEERGGDFDQFEIGSINCVQFYPCSGLLLS